jgi:monooxygenase
MEHVDVLIIGAGISGIGAGCHLTINSQGASPGRTFAILEGRKNLGGTWDLFKYPGIRSDSDMYTFGYAFRPWTEGKDIASASSILRYLKQTCEEYGVDKKIRYGHRVTKVNWSSKDKHWLVDFTNADGSFQMSCKFLLTCTGYFNYNKAYLPKFDGYNDYKGMVVQPQFWPEDLDYKDKTVLVIGSGATAITLVPSMAAKTKHITMLQRSPTYVFTRPAKDKIANFLRKVLPNMMAYRLSRTKNVLLNIFMFNRARKKPEKVRKFLREMTKEELGDSVDVDVHFNPRYDPWDQRICLVPDSDLFNVLKDGSASIVTDHIERFTKTGVRLTSGGEINADIIVPATGLSLQFLGGIEASVDGKKLVIGDMLNYKGMMFGGVPNMAAVFGYTNASWTLKADLTCGYVARLLNYMDKHGYVSATPTLPETMGTEPLVNLQSGYFLRSLGALPKQGVETPWRNPENYLKDYKTIRWGKFDDGVMAFE